MRNISRLLREHRADLLKIATCQLRPSRQITRQLFRPLYTGACRNLRAVRAVPMSSETKALYRDVIRAHPIEHGLVFLNPLKEVVARSESRKIGENLLTIG